jgi:hypothetical protein
MIASFLRRDFARDHSSGYPSRHLPRTVISGSAEADVATRVTPQPPNVAT